MEEEFCAKPMSISSSPSLTTQKSASDRSQRVDMSASPVARSQASMAWKPTKSW
jgi:hypothetical protein